jgi:transposase
MRTGISITITRSVRGRVEAITRDRNASQKHAWRAAIILSSADGVGTNEIMRRTGKSKTCVWRWQERFMKEGIDGLLHDKTRPSRIPPLGPEVAARVVALEFESYHPSQPVRSLWAMSELQKSARHSRELARCHPVSVVDFSEFLAVTG